MRKRMKAKHRAAARPVSKAWYIKWPSGLTAFYPLRFREPIRFKKAKGERAVRDYVRRVLNCGKRLPVGFRCWPSC